MMNNLFLSGRRDHGLFVKIVAKLEEEISQRKLQTPFHFIYCEPPNVKCVRCVRCVKCVSFQILCGFQELD